MPFMSVKKRSKFFARFARILIGVYFKNPYLLEQARALSGGCSDSERDRSNSSWYEEAGPSLHISLFRQY